MSCLLAAKRAWAIAAQRAGPGGADAQRPPAVATWGNSQTLGRPPTLKKSNLVPTQRGLSVDIWVLLRWVSCTGEEEQADGRSEAVKRPAGRWTRQAA